MNKDILDALTIAAFFHDLGKFAERSDAVSAGDWEEVKQEYRYGHAYNTEIALKALFSTERLEKQFGSDPQCNILNMAARHHKPRNEYEIIISEADRIASGHERIQADNDADFEVGGRQRRNKLPLISILSRIRLRNAFPQHNNDWRYRVRSADFFFGNDFGELFPLDSGYSAKEVQSDYLTHWNGYVDAIKGTDESGLDIIDNFTTLFEISKMYQWCLPASTRKEELADVSLFDHNKATAALASCIYCYHAEQGGANLSEREIRDRNIKKYLLFCGDISGIQKFIYQISSRGAYRTLKGRSFYIQIVAELLARQIVDMCGLKVSNMLYASGGKFYLLLPNTPSIKDLLVKIQHNVNSELFKKFNGELYIRTGYEEISGADLTRQSGRTLYNIWDDLSRKLVFQDRQRYAVQVTVNYDFLFNTGQQNTGTCKVCHASMKNKDESVCKVCQEMESLGRVLGTSNYVVLSNHQSGVDERYAFKFNGTYVWLCDKLPVSFHGTDTIVMSLNDKNFSRIPAYHSADLKLNAVPFVVGSTHRFDKTFDEIADTAKGIKRLGILRMDVDNLGKIFSEGLENYRHAEIQDERFHSLGRITTLSWQLSMFFAGMIPQIIKHNDEWSERVTVVYSGGDDLFLLGAWDAIPEIALTIRQEFNRFSCNNNSFALSGGMVITGGKFPIYKSAELAGNAEELAKGNVTVFKEQKTRVKKDSFTFLDKPMHWEEFTVLAKQFDRLMSVLQSRQNFPLLHRIRDIAAVWEKNRHAMSLAHTKMTMEQIKQRLMAQRWQWLMVYALARFTEKHGHLKDEIEKLQKFIVNHVAGTEKFGIELLGVLSRWCELSLRNR